MESEKHRLECKIHYLEDKLLRSKNVYEMEQLQQDLRSLRFQLQRESNGTRGGAYERRKYYETAEMD